MITKLSKTDRQTVIISVSSSGNVRKCEFSTGEDVLPEKGLFLKKLLQSKDLNTHL